MLGPQAEDPGGQTGLLLALAQRSLGGALTGAHRTPGHTPGSAPVGPSGSQLHQDLDTGSGISGAAPHEQAGCAEGPPMPIPASAVDPSAL